MINFVKFGEDLIWRIKKNVEFGGDLFWRMTHKEIKFYVLKCFMKYKNKRIYKYKS